MIRAKDNLAITLRKTLTIQAVLTIVAALIVFQIKGFGFALALVYGGAVTIAGTWIHAWRLLKIAVTDVDNASAHAGVEVVKGAILKLATMMGLLALGMGYFKLEALAILIGFIVAYFGLVFVRGYAPRSKQGK